MLCNTGTVMVAFLMHGIVAWASRGKPWTVYFPAISLAVLVFLSEGSFFYATSALFAHGADDGTGPRWAVVLVSIVGYATGLIPFIVVGFVQFKWVFLDEQHLYDSIDIQRAPWRQRAVLFFTSTTYWTPIVTAKCWGSVFQMYRSETRWFHFILLGGNALTAIIVGSSRSASLCASQVTLILCVYVLQLLVLVALRPFRQPFLQALSVLSCGIRVGEVLALVAFVWSSDLEGASLSELGFALHVTGDGTLVLLTLLCVVANILDRVHISPQVKRHQHQLDSILSSRTTIVNAADDDSEGEDGGYIMVDGGTSSANTGGHSAQWWSRNALWRGSGPSLKNFFSKQRSAANHDSLLASGELS